MSALVIGWLASFGLIVAIAGLSIKLGWANRAPEGEPEFGINFSCRQMEYLLLDHPPEHRAEWCAAQFDDMLSGLGARYVRVSVEWATVEPRPGPFDFSLIDALLQVAERRRARVLLTVGMKAQRYPEYYLPAWATEGISLPVEGDPSAYPGLRDASLRMIAAVVAHTAASPAIDAWQAENEPFIPTGPTGYWRLDRDYVRQVIALIRANDPQRRPVAQNHNDHILFHERWRYAVEDADIVAMSVFPFRPTEFFGVEFVQDILQWGVLTPNYPDHARTARAEGKQYWITEMQAETWAGPDVRAFGPANPAPDLPPERMARMLQYARRSGASRVYLWGAEWWVYQRDSQGDSRHWDAARAALQYTPVSP